ncbi:MAG TPA: sigma-70 family RNA polymerase sigma factor [Planctomycetota bacterium]|nr:sigma-70 family RNA polymerase sigma factor [Planctomycetota bacterium]
MSELLDADLVSRMARGDQAALAELYDRHAPSALALAMRVTGDRAEGEDVLQTVFLKLWNSAGSFDATRGSVQSWILASVRNASIDRIRRRQAHERAVREAPVAAADRGPGPDEESAKRAAALIGSLPPDQREAIELAYFQGLTQSQIAERLNQPLGTIKTRLRLGMMKLREAFAGRAEKK